MYIKDMERLVRTLHRQKCDAEYIRHYLMETYQVTDAVVDQVFITCGVGSKADKRSVVKSAHEMMGGKKADRPADGKVKRSEYF